MVPEGKPDVASGAARDAFLERLSALASTRSHELRGPLGRIFGYLELLRDEEFGPVLPEQKRILDTLLRETDDLIAILSAVLELAWLDSGDFKPRCQKVVISDLIPEVRVAILGAEEVVTWDVPADLPCVVTDRARLKQALTGIVRHAVRHAGGKAVRVRGCGAGGQGLLEICVATHAASMEEEEVRALLDGSCEPERSDAVQDADDICLYFMRRLVGLLGGTLVAGHTADAAPCFRLQLRLAA